MIMAFKTEIDGKEYYALTQEELDILHDACVVQTAMIQELEGQLVNYYYRVSTLNGELNSKFKLTRNRGRKEVTSDWVKIFCEL